MIALRIISAFLMLMVTLVTELVNSLRGSPDLAVASYSEQSLSGANYRNPFVANRARELNKLYSARV